MNSMNRRSVLKGLGGVVATTSAVASRSTASAKATQLRIAYQPSLNFLPLMVMEHEKLVESELKRRSRDVAITWLRFSSGGPMNDALLSGQIDIASGGITVLAVLWDKTRGRLAVKGLTSLAASPYFLNVNKSSIRSLHDFTDKDRIAVPVGRISPNAIVLQMAAEKIFGRGQQERLDSLVVSMANPEAHAALLGRRTEISAHMCAPPFCFQQLRQPGIHRVLSSSEILGKEASTIVTWTTSEFMRTHPTEGVAFIAALEAANKLIATEPRRAAQIYKSAMKASQPAEEFEAIIREPDISFSAAPKNSLQMVSFMRRVGTLKASPSDWKEFFFPNVHGLDGS
jgi:NitT/TauT family transport system substrate-binding protein